MASPCPGFISRAQAATGKATYLTNWRLGIAQAMLRKGNSLKLITTY
jgi:hypothetical protein